LQNYKIIATARFSLRNFPYLCEHYQNIRYMLFKNIRIVDDIQDFVGDVRIKDSKIVEVGHDLHDSEEIDYQGKNVALLPAFTDLHVHFRDPGLTHKEDVNTGSHAAVRGGYTAVNLMPNTKPVCSSMEIVRDVENRVAEIGLIYANQTLSMTKNLEGKDFRHLLSLNKEEILFVTDDGKGVNDDDVMEEIFKICKEKNIGIMSHTEKSEFSATDMRKAENEMTFRDIALCEKTQGRIHFCHVSTKEAIEAIIAAKKKGLQVTCEVAPHHIAATGEEVNHYRVNPPFREKEDVQALIEAMQNGMVDTISTDHAPRTADDKKNGSPGMTGLELAFPMCYTKLVAAGYLSLSQLVKMMSTTPSAMLKLNKGRIQEGMDADLVVVDTEEKYCINADELVSKGKNTPFNGWTVQGRVLRTMRAGKFVY